MKLLECEELNFRSALRRAFQCRDKQDGIWMATTLRSYLERTDRLRERDAVLAWVHSQLAHDTSLKLDSATCAALLQHALSRVNHGQAAEAIATVRDLIERLEVKGLADNKDATFEIALCYDHLGMIYVDVDRPDLAIEPLQHAINLFRNISSNKVKISEIFPVIVYKTTLPRL